MSSPVNKHFVLSDDICYLNHAAVSPWPQVTARAVSDFAHENATLGAAHYPRWLRVERELRDNLKTLINACSVNEIALQKNTSEALSTIAYGIDWHQGDQIIISNQEFPSNRIVWESLARFGVELIIVDISGNDPEAALAAAMSSKTRLLSISSVQYASGLRMDLARLGAACKRHDVLFCIDAIQSLGALSFDVQAYKADFVVADAHKWLMGPEGIALLYVRDALIPTLALNEFGWHMVKNAGNYDEKTWTAASSARRFECGSPNMLGIHGFHASLGLLLDVGMDAVAEQLAHNVEYLKQLLSQRDDIRIVSPQEAFRSAGIVTFTVGDTDPQALYRYLMGKDVICACRGGGVRFSPHFYTTKRTLERAVAAIPEHL